MKRGDIVTVAATGDDGKPRPAVVVQTDLLNDTHASVVVCLITSSLVDAPLLRLTVEPSERNGLRRRSQVMVDKLAPYSPFGAHAAFTATGTAHSLS